MGWMRGCVIVLALAALACAEGTNTPAIQVPEGSRRMVRRLDSLWAVANHEFTPYHSDSRVEGILSQPVAADPASQLQHRYFVANELLWSGRFAEAIEIFEWLAAMADSLPRDFGDAVLQQLAISHLHRSFQETCVRDRTVEPCTFPMGSRSRDTESGDSRAAIPLYERVLRDHPEDLRARWLLNLAHMNAGSYPDGVLAEHLIPPSAFEDEYRVERFPDVAPALGLDVLGRAGAAILDDFDRDGFLDVFVSSWGIHDQMRFFRNRGDGQFEDRTAAAGLVGLTGGLHAMQTDYDNDGFLDVFVLRGAWLFAGYPNSLLRNRGDGTFEDVTEEAGLLNPYPTQTAAWGDYDNDGWLDVFVGNESREGVNRSPAQLFRNNRNGTFTDVAEEAGIAVVGNIKGVTAGDYDDDGRLDLYLSRGREPNLLFHNEGVDESGMPRFVEVSRQAGVTEPLASFPTWFFDYDDDGRLDLFVSAYWADATEVAREYLGLPLRSGTPRLYRNLGDGTFEDVTRSARLVRVMETMGSNFGDLDSDGYPDIYVGTGDPDLRQVMPSRMFRNDGGRVFQEVTASGGFGTLAKGHGVAFGDADNDGDQDIYMNLGGAYLGDRFNNVFFANPGTGNAWITLRLEGVQSNRAAIGARIRVRVETPGGVRDTHATLGSGGSFGANSLQQEMGLGDATAIREIEVWWPTSGRRDVYDAVPLNGIYRVREGASDLEVVEHGSFDLMAFARRPPDRVRRP